MSIPYYFYQPLKEKQIRVLEVYPGLESDPVSCNLHLANLGSGVKYEAVSYSWGNGPSDRLIYINGGHFHVTANLEAALKVFRHEIVSNARHSSILDDFNERLKNVEFNDTYKWIDALCINQEDNNERNDQIQLMRNIYSQSVRLVVWLGEEPEHNDLAIDTVMGIVSSLRLSDNKVKPWLNQQSVPSLITKSCALATIFLRPWFSRAWVLQEYVVTSKTEAIFFYGRRKISGGEINTFYSAIDDIVDHLYEIEGEALEFLPAYGTYANETEQEKKDKKVWNSPQDHSRVLFKRLVADILRGRADWKLLQDCSDLYNGKESGQLEPWLSRCRPRDATDPRDKLYGILGLLEDLNERYPTTRDFIYEDLIIDYSADVQDVYSSIVRASVMATKQLFILAAHRGNSELVTRSWTPDWTQEFDGFLNRKTSFKEGRLVTDFSAAGNEDAHAIFAEDLSTMTIRGFVFDDVIFVSRCLVNLDYQSSFLVCEARLRSLYECAAAKCSAGAMDNLKQKVWQNLIVASEFEFEGKEQQDNVQNWFSDMFVRWDDIRLSGADPKIVPDDEKIYCDNVECGKEILEMRHKCMYCADFDLCSDCKPLSTTLHPINHTFFRIHTPILGKNPPSEPSVAKFIDAIDWNARIFLTQEGYVGHTRSIIQRNDCVSIVKGSDVPLILMELEKGGCEFIGEAFVYGIMQGEALKDGADLWQDFVLH